MLHGWPPLRGVDRVNSVWGRVWATTSRGASRFIPSVHAREFDVIEIRRTWYFDTAIRLY